MALYANRHIQNAAAATWQGAAHPQVPVFTYYELLNSAGAGEGAGEVAAIKYAPNATVGLHASPWNYTVAGDGAATGAYRLALGAADGDFVVTDPSDRDAGYYTSMGQNRWWTDTTAATYLSWSKAVSDTVGKTTANRQAGGTSLCPYGAHREVPIDSRVPAIRYHPPPISPTSGPQRRKLCSVM